MANFIRGKVKIEDSDIGNENGRWVVMYEIDCLPPPTGSERTYNFDKKAGSLVQQKFIQQSEMTALLDGANTPGAITDAAGILQAILTSFAYPEVTIDESKIPEAWKNTEKCFWVTISYRVKYIIKEIKVTATQEFVSGNSTFPAGDTVASFRILVPEKYEFMRSYMWNPECCKGETPIEKQPDYCDPFPTMEYKWYPLPPGMKYKWGFGLEYDWGKYKYEEENPEGH